MLLYNNKTKFLYFLFITKKLFIPRPPKKNKQQSLAKKVICYNISAVFDVFALVIPYTPHLCPEPIPRPTQPFQCIVIILLQS